MLVESFGLQPLVDQRPIVDMRNSGARAVLEDFEGKGTAAAVSRSEKPPQSTKISASIRCGWRTPRLPGYAARPWELPATAIWKPSAARRRRQSPPDLAVERISFRSARESMPGKIHTEQMWKPGLSCCTHPSQLV